MPRPVKCRQVDSEPGVTYFKPAGVMMRDLSEVVLNLEEFEALRLIDFEQKDQQEAAKRMRVSQPTFSRVLDSARKKVSQFLIEGKALRVEGGTYKTRDR